MLLKRPQRPRRAFRDRPTICATSVTFPRDAVVSLGPAGVQAVLQTSSKLDLQSPTTVDAATARLLFPPKAGGDASAEELKLNGINIAPTFFANANKSGFLNGKAVVLVAQGQVFISHPRDVSQASTPALSTLAPSARAPSD